MCVCVCVCVCVEGEGLTFCFFHGFLVMGVAGPIGRGSPCISARRHSFTRSDLLNLM